MRTVFAVPATSRAMDRTPHELQAGWLSLTLALVVGAFGTMAAVACDGGDEEGELGSARGACEIAGEGIRDSCYEDYSADECDGSFATFYPGDDCPSAGYALACCGSASDDPSLFRPSGQACDETQDPCGSSDDDDDCYGDCIDVCLQAGGSSCADDCAGVC